MIIFMVMLYSEENKKADSLRLACIFTILHKLGHLFWVLDCIGVWEERLLKYFMKFYTLFIPSSVFSFWHFCLLHFFWVTYLTQCDGKIRAVFCMLHSKAHTAHIHTKALTETLSRVVTTIKKKINSMARHCTGRPHRSVPYHFR